MSKIKIIAKDGLSLGKGYVSTVCEQDDCTGNLCCYPNFLILETEETLENIKYLEDVFYSATLTEDDGMGGLTPKFLSKRKWKINIATDLDSTLLAEAVASDEIIPIPVDITKFVEGTE